MSKLSEKYKAQNFEEIKDQKTILDYYKDKDSKGLLSVYSQEEVHRRIVNLFMNQLHDIESLYKDHKPILNKLKEILLLDKLALYNVTHKLKKSQPHVQALFILFVPHKIKRALNSLPTPKK